MTRSRTVFWALATMAILLVTSALLFAESGGDDWPQFRGINRDGASAETGLLDEWPEAGPKEVWRVPIGEGYSSISVVGGVAYTMYAGDHDGEPTEFAAAYDTATGKQIWRSVVGKKYDNEFGNGPRATPTVDGDTLYVLGSYGNLTALSVDDGSKRWAIDLTEKFGSKVPTFGFSTSALIDGEQLVVEGGGPEGKSYAALNKANGKVIWTFGEGGREPGYSSPLKITMDGKTRYVYIAGPKMYGIAPDGKEVWSYDWPRGESHAIPIFVAPNGIFASGAEGVGGTLLQVGEVDGVAIVEEKWKTRFMRNHFNASVVHDGYLYGFDNATLKCISLTDAKMAWAKRGLGKGSLIVADGNLLVLTDQGRMLLVGATPDGYVEKGSVQVLENKCWTAPTLSRGKVYMRNHTEMVAYDLKG